MKYIFSHYLAPAFCALLFASSAVAQSTASPSEDWTTVNLAITDNHVIPRYQAFARSAQALADAGSAFCAGPTATALAGLQDAYHDSADSWQQIQHVQFGPITYFSWNFRLQHWPDENGAGARQLDALIAAQNAAALESDIFARESISVQGFPALERLLFEEDSLAALQADPFRCRVAQTITRNISEIATGVHSVWVDDFRDTVATADERGFFESAEDATIDFLKAQVEPVRRIQQQKLEAVIGEAEGRERVRRAESWRSARSIRNVRQNVQAMENLFNGQPDQAAKLRDVFYEEDATGVDAIFVTLQDTLADMPDSYDAVFAEEGGRAQIENLALQLDALFEALEAALKNTDLYLGFNSLDGD